MGGNTPCASCKKLRRGCTKNCIFAPYFPSDDPQKFAIVHRVFGSSNVGKMLQQLPVHQREDAVKSLVYEAQARLRNPVYGCTGAISYLQDMVEDLQRQLAVAEAEKIRIQVEQHYWPTMMPSAMEDPNQNSYILQNDLPQYTNHASSSDAIYDHMWT